MTLVEQVPLVDPVETKMVELSELMASRVGSVNPKSFLDEKFELFSIPAFDLGAAEITSGMDIGSSKQNVQPGDILLSKIVPHIRRSWIVTPQQGFRQIASGEWIIFRDSRIHGPYLRQVLVSDNFNLQFMQTVAGVGGSLLRARPAHVAKIRVPLPPLPEQRRIAAILDKADRLRTQRREALARLDDLERSIFDSMFAELPAENVLSDAVSALIGGKNVVGADDSTNPYRVLKISAVTSGQYLESESKALPSDYHHATDHIVRSGDVIISRANTTELVGASALVAATNGQTVLPDKLWRAVPTDQVDPRYLVATLQSNRIRAEISSRSTGSGGSMKNISKPKLLSVPIAIPPLELQQAFASRVAGVERLKKQHRAQLAELEAFFASLQHRAFRGEL